MNVIKEEALLQCSNDTENPIDDSLKREYAIIFANKERQWR